MNFLLDFHDFFIVLFRLKGSSCIRSVSLSQASWLRVAKYHFAVTQYSLIPASASRWPTQNPGFVCSAVVNLWYMIRTQPYLQNTKQPRDMLLEPDISLRENRCPLREGNTHQGKKIRWNGKKTVWERRGFSDLCMGACLFSLLHVDSVSMLFKVGSQTVGMNDWSSALVYGSWNQGTESRPLLVSLGLEMTHSRGDILRLPAGIWSALCWQLPVFCFELPHFPSVKLFHVLSTDKHFDLLLRLYRFYSDALTKVYGGKCSGGFRSRNAFQTCVLFYFIFCFMLFYSLYFICFL